MFSPPGGPVPHPWSPPQIALATLTRSTGHTRSPTCKWNSPVSSSDRPLDSAVHLMTPQAASPPSAPIGTGWLPRWVWEYDIHTQDDSVQHQASNTGSHLHERARLFIFGIWVTDSVNPWTFQAIHLISIRPTSWFLSLITSSLHACFSSVASTLYSLLLRTYLQT